MGPRREETVRDSAIGDLGGAADRADRQAATKMLGNRDDVGRHARLVLETKQLPRLAEASLRFIENQCHAARTHLVLQRLVVALRWHNDTTRAEHRLADEGGWLAGEIRIRQLEAGL